MKLFIQYGVGFILFVLIISNIFIFVSSMQLGDKINYYDRETRRLRQENMELERKLYSLDSLQYAASMAARLDFTKKAEPYFLEHLGFALKK